MNALIVTTTAQELEKFGVVTDVPLHDADLYGLRIIRTAKDESHGTDTVRLFTYDLQSLDRDGHWHSVPIADHATWIPALKTLCQRGSIISVQDAVAELGITRARICVLIRSGRLKATKNSAGDYEILFADLDAVRHRPLGVKYN